jgi:hypothetical protein
MVMTARESNVDRPALVGGIALAVLGVLLALARLDLVPGEVLAPWWPLLLAAFGAYRLVSGSAEARRGGAWMLVLAGWMLLNTLGIAGLWWSNSWPLLPLLLGLFQIAWPEGRGERFGGLVLVAIGLWLLLATRGVLGLDLSTSWPLVLVFVGVAIALRALSQARSRAAGRRTS